MINPKLNVGDRVVLLHMDGETSVSPGEQGTVISYSIVFGDDQYTVSWDSGSLGMTLHKVTNIMSYTFIIPLIPMLYNLGKGDSDSFELSHIAQRLAGFGLLTISGVILKELINKLIKRFRNKN